MAKNNKGNEKRNLPAITKNVAKIIDKKNIKPLAPFAIFLLFVLANQLSRKKMRTKIIIPKKNKFIY
jgi:hypothetical protein